MLDALVGLGQDAHRDQELLREIGAYSEALRAAAGRGDTGLVARAEEEVKRDRRVFSFDPGGKATLTAAGHTWSAGRFEVVSIAALRARARQAKAHAAPAGAPRVRAWVLDGAAPGTDIGALQAHAGRGALFLPGDLDVIVNGRDLSRRLPRERILEPVRASGGAMVTLDRADHAMIVR